MSCGGIFDLAGKQNRLAEVEKLFADPGIWNDQKRAQELGREKKSLEGTVGSLTGIGAGLKDAKELFEMARAENDDATLERHCELWEQERGVRVSISAMSRAIREKLGWSYKKRRWVPPSETNGRGALSGGA